MAKFRLYDDGKFRLMTDKGLFVASSEKHSIKEVNKAFDAGLFQKMKFTTKDGEPVFCIPSAAKEVGADVNLTVKVKAEQDNDILILDGYEEV